MCGGGGGSSAPAKVDPTPVQVTSANTGADQAEANDRYSGTLLGGVSAGDTSGTVSNLGGVK